MILSDLKPGDLFICIPEDEHHREMLESIVFRLEGYNADTGGVPCPPRRVAGAAYFHAEESAPGWAKLACQALMPAWIELDTPVVLYVETEEAE